MIYGVVNNKVTNAEEYLIDFELRKGQPINVNRKLIDISIKFDNQEVDTFILDVIDDRLIVQLVLPLKDIFDDEIKIYKNSYIRKLLNSDDFLSRFNQEFVKCIKPTILHTEDYTTVDKLWLLSHEEVGQDAGFLSRNNNCRPFDLFEHIDMRSYSQALLKLNKQQCYGWRLRSVTPHTTYKSLSRFVGFVDSDGDVDSNIAYGTDSGALLPACTICWQSYI